MKKTLYLILLTVLFNLQSCDDYVDIEPKGSAIASTLEDINLLLDDANRLSSLLGNSIPVLLNDNLQVEDETLAITASSLESSFISNIYNLEPQFHIANQTDEVWASHYETIGTMNYILEVLDGIDTDNSLKNQYIAEAKVHRAYHYFKLVNVYGVHYGLPEASQAGSGVPILTVFSDDTVSLVRASVNEVYDFILNDLNEALPFLEESVISNDRASKASGQGLLAEVEMHRGNYNIASGLIDDALAFNNNLIDYNTDLIASYPPRGIANPESLFSKTSDVLLNFDRSGGVFSLQVFSTYSNELIAITDTASDLRFVSLTQENAFGNFALTNTAARYEVGVTVPRLMLFKAECLARNNDFTAAMNLVNQLRAKRFDADIVSFGGHILTASSKEEALQHIMDETRREFHVTGLRFFDIKRLNAIENAGISITRKGKTYTANSINWAVPISESVLETSNGQISQNPRE